MLPLLMILGHHVWSFLIILVQNPSGMDPDQQIQIYIFLLCSRDVRVIMPDLRNHGLTAQMNGFHPPHTLESTAQDVLSFVDTMLDGKMPQLIVGLSLGGKVSLEILQQLQQQQNVQEEAKELREREQHTESIETSGHVLVHRPQQVS